MPYVQFDDNLPEHPKFLRVGEEATDLFLRGNFYCSRHLTDGEIPKAALRLLSGKPHAGELAAGLVAHGLWEDRGETWVVVGYLDHNRSRAKVEADRAAARARMTRPKRAASPEVRAGFAGSSGEVPPNVGGSSGELHLPTPLHSTPLEEREAEEDRSPPIAPPPQGAVAPAADAAPPRRKRAKRERPPDERVERVAQVIYDLVGVDYPPNAWDALRAAIDKGGLSEADAVAIVRHASTQEFWRGSVKLDPAVIFRPSRWPTLLAQAKARPAGPRYEDPFARPFALPPVPPEDPCA